PIWPAAIPVRRGTSIGREWVRRKSFFKAGNLAHRRLWSTLAVDCMDDANQLSKPLRAQIVSLSLWVSKYSSQVMQDGAPLEPLIDVNRTIMQGLQAAA